ncbi:MAG: hypothetical protein NC251_13775 [Lachnoclostridium sp.]|nr:hypothetical protein [Lachnospira sp.]MCM1249475.1 hypothetical protein [Lachnoclostridium sp.]
MWRNKRRALETADNPKAESKAQLWKYAGIFLFVCIPLISAVLFCAADGRRISDIYIPLGGWSDEIGYYKQVEGILSHGLPRGYFGYNQSRALYGSLGSWGIVLLIPYVLWGFFFGWNYCSPIYANIFFCMAALAIGYFLLRPRPKQMGIFALFWIANPFLNRYVLSGVVEAAVIMELMIVIICGEALLSETTGLNKAPQSTGKHAPAMVCCTALTILLTLARPYFAVFFLIPLWKAIKKRQKAWVIGLPFLAVGAEVLFFLNSHYFCAPYFSDILPFDELFSAGAGGFIVRFFHGFVEIAKLIWYALRYPGIGVGWYYLLLAVELGIMAFWCVRRKCCGKVAPPMFFIAMAGELLVLFSIIQLYDLGEGARHILSLIVVNAVLLVAEIPSVLPGGALAVICILSLFRIHGADGLPYKDSAYSAYMEILKQQLSEAVTVTNEISYDNVVAMPTADRDSKEPDTYVSTYYGLMYAMPAGVGISLDFQDYYDNPANIKAGYILVHPNGEIRMKLEEIGMICVFQNEEMMVYSRRF